MSVCASVCLSVDLICLYLKCGSAFMLSDMPRSVHVYEHVCVCEECISVCIECISVCVECSSVSVVCV